jgi:hypothetical protein
MNVVLAERGVGDHVGCGGFLLCERGIGGQGVAIMYVTSVVAMV